MFKASQQRLIQYVGKTQPSHITRPGWKEPVTAFCEQFEKSNSGVENAEIRGAEPHKSRDDPSDTQEVISIRFSDASGKRIASAHVHKDGTGKVVRW